MSLAVLDLGLGVLEGLEFAPAHALLLGEALHGSCGREQLLVLRDDELRQRFVGMLVPQAEILGITLPDENLR